MQLEVKTILNRIQHFAGFVYQEVRFGYSAKGRLQIHVRLEPHRSMHATCSECRKPAPGYDRLPQRRWLFVPLWGIKTYFLYASRRVECPEHGVVVEHIPWSDGSFVVVGSTTVPARVIAYFFACGTWTFPPLMVSGSNVRSGLSPSRPSGWSPSIRTDRDNKVGAEVEHPDS